MILRVKVKDISNFCGYVGGDNEELLEYIRVFKENPKFDCLMFECNYNGLNINQIAYMADELRNCQMYAGMEYDDSGKPEKAAYKISFIKNAKGK